MNATELLLPDHRPAGVWFCTQCRQTHGLQESADKCCLCTYCHEPLPLDTSWRRFEHPECSSKRDAEFEQRRIDKAEKLDNWDGWVFLDGAGSNEGYFESLSELLGWAEDEETTLPEYVFVCEEEDFDGPDINQILEHIGESNYPDIVDHLDGVEELTEAIDKFNDANKERVHYTVDHKRVVKTGFVMQVGGPQEEGLFDEVPDES